ncbi:MAG TPA: D-amino acid aminotransferase [Burkholderiales bacterium]|nr:D-amino acid aminotransferase [Burkholderiales bacterium]
MTDIAYLNGEFLPLDQAKVSVLDRGFIFGDGVYEVIPAYSRRLFRLPEHLVRLQHSCDAIRLTNPMADAEWTRLIQELITRHPYEDQSVYLQVTRGVARRDHAFPKDAKPTVFMMSGPLTTPSKEQLDNGVACITASDFRWLKCDVKSVSLLGNCLLRQAAADAGAVEVVLFRDGCLTEASSSNVFVVRDGKLLAPPKDNLILPGITYDVVLELAAACGVPVERRPVTEAEVRSADEIWVTSSTKEVLAVTTLDGAKVGSGRPGEVFRVVHQEYQEFKRKLMRQAA